MTRVWVTFAEVPVGAAYRVWGESWNESATQVKLDAVNACALDYYKEPGTKKAVADALALFPTRPPHTVGRTMAAINAEVDRLAKNSRELAARMTWGEIHPAVPDETVSLRARKAATGPHQSKHFGKKHYTIIAEKA